MTKWRAFIVHYKIQKGLQFNNHPFPYIYLHLHVMIFASLNGKYCDVRRFLMRSVRSTALTLFYWWLRTKPIKINKPGCHAVENTTSSCYHGIGLNLKTDWTFNCLLDWKATNHGLSVHRTNCLVRVRLT